MRLPRCVFASLAVLLGSCGETIEVSQAEPFVGSAGVSPDLEFPQEPAKGTAPSASPAIGDDDGWEFAYRDTPATAKGRARLDLRSMNERVAGESGFVRLSSDGNSFLLGSGVPARFWAINSEVFRYTPEQIDRNVRFLARLGVNMVRLHAQISPKGKESRAIEVDEKEIDGIWRYVAAAKEQGIYTTISPFWANGANAAKWGIEGYGNEQVYGLLFFDETLQAAYKSWTKALLTRPNPYTGVPLAQEPAVAILQVQNEDSLFFWTFDAAIKPPAKAKLAAKFTAWVVAKYGSIPKAMAAYDNARIATDDPKGGRLGFLDVWTTTQHPAGGVGRRSIDQVAFLAETQRKFYEGIAAYFKEELGCRQLVNASNWRTADQTRLDDLERWSYAGTDVIAVNRYYNGGVHLGANAGWRIDPGDKFSQKSALVDPRAMPFNIKQVVGHPMIVTESSWVAPLAFAAEGPFLAAVYPSLSGVDAFYWFNSTTPEYDLDPFFPYAKVKGQAPLMKFSAMTPTILGGFPAASVLFRNGYVKAGSPVVHEERTLASMYAREDPILAEDPAFDPNRDPGITPDGGSSRKPGSSGVDPLAFLVGPVEVRYGSTAGETRVLPELTRLIDPKKKVIRSITGEITLDYGKGVCRVDTPKAQGACGFLSQAGPLQFRDLGINSANAFASVLVVALDDAPLSRSRRILVQVTTATRPSGWATTPTEFDQGPKTSKIRGFEVTQTGHPPWRIANTEVGLALKNPNLTKATAIDPAGFYDDPVPLSRTKTGVTLTLPPDAMYVVLE